MNRTDSNRGGYKSCELRKKLNGEILDRFPAEIREKMVAFDNGDFLRLATEREMFGENIYGEQEDDSVQQWEPMKDRRNRIGFQGNKTGIWEWCWLQNKTEDYAATFCSVNYDGNAIYHSRFYRSRCASRFQNHYLKSRHFMWRGTEDAHEIYNNQTYPSD